MERQQALISHNVAVLDQGRDLVERLGPERYATAGRRAARSGVASHLRHCLDFYGCFLDGVEAGRIDYTVRARDERVERDAPFAAARIAHVASRLDALRAREANRDLLVRGEEGPDGSGAEWTVSSAARELQFLMSHTIHHFAIVAMALRFEGHAVPEGLGVAPSTLAYWRRAS